MRPIVVADQSPSLRKLFELTFSEEYEVLFADNAKGLSETVEEKDPGIVFLDADFVADQDELQALIQSISSVPVVLLRGEFSEVESLEGISREIKKPFDPDELIQCYDELVTSAAGASSDFDDLFSSIGTNSLDEEVSKEINDLFRPDSAEASGDLDIENLDMEIDPETAHELEGLLESQDGSLDELLGEEALETEDDEVSEKSNNFGADQEISMDDIDLENLDDVLDSMGDVAVALPEEGGTDPLDDAFADMDDLSADATLDALKDAQDSDDENPYLNVEEPEEIRPEPAAARGSGDHHVRLTDLQLTIPESFTPKVYFPEPKGDFSELRFVVDRSYIEDFLRHNLREHLRELLSEQIQDMLPEIARQVVEEELERLKQIKIDDI